MSASGAGDSIKHRQRLRELSKYYCVALPPLISDDNLLDSPAHTRQPIRLASDEQLTALAQLAAVRVRCKHAFVSLIDDHYQHIIAEASQSISPFDENQHDPDDGLILGIQSIPLHLTGSPLTLEAFCSDTQPQFGLAENRADRDHVVVTDLSIEPTTRHWPILQHLPVLRYYIEVPLRSHQGHLLGSLCVVDDRPRSPRAQDVRVLQEVARIILKHLDWARRQEDHARAERLLEGLSHFNQGRDSISDWSRETQGQDHIPSVYPTAMPLLSSVLPDPTPSDLLTTVASSSSSNPPIDDVDKEIHLSSAAASTQHTSTAPTTVSGDGADPTASSSGPIVDTAFNLTPDKSETDDPHAATLVSNNVRHAFARASNLIREAMGLDTACFLEIPHNERHKRPVRPLKSKRSSIDGPQPSESDSCADSSSDTATQVEISPSDDGSTPSGDVLCHRLGFSSRIKSSLAASKTAPNYLAVSVQLLMTLTVRYPDGHIFHFDQQGNLSSSDDAQKTKQAQKRPTRKKKVSAQLISAFPDARSMIFLPLYDNDKQQIYASFLGWTTSNTRSLQPYELLYVSGFTHSIMCEVMRLDALAMNQAKSNFISSISHELRSPLHGILAANQLLSDPSQVRPQQLEFVRMIDTCARTLLDIMNHLLDHAKINHFTNKQNEKVRPSLKDRRLTDLKSYSLISTTNLLALVEETVASVTASSSQMLVRGDVGVAGVTPLSDASYSPGKAEKLSPPVILNIEPRDIWNFNTEAGSWRRILMNLLGNSLKYTQQGHVSISLTFRALNATKTGADCLAELKITDTGKGISEEYLKHRLYTPFAQEDNLSVGTGLGLSLVRQMVSSLHGDIDIKSEIGTGTEALVQIPLSSSRDQTQDLESQDGSRSALLTQSRGKCFKLWGFDDQAALRDETSTGVPSPFTTALMVAGESVSTMLSDWFGMRPALDGAVDVHVIEESFFQANLEVFDQVGKNLIVIGFMGRSKVIGGTRKANIQYAISPLGPTRTATALRELLEVRESPPSTAETSSPATTLDASIMRPPLTSPSHYTENTSVEASSQLTSSPSIEVDLPMSVATTDVLPTNPSPSKNVVLLVDDNQINLRILVATVSRLKSKSVDYITAVNGQDALDKYIAAIDNGKRVSLCFMDISMPVMDGFEATKWIRSFEKARRIERTKRTTIVALTGLASEEAQHQIESCGFDMYLRKPVDLKTLQELLAVEDKTKTSDPLVLE